MPFHPEQNRSSSLSSPSFPPPPPPPPLRHPLLMIPSLCRNCWRNLNEKIRETGREGGRERGREGEREGGKEEGKEEGSVRAILSHRLTPNKARNSVHQATCREKQAVATKKTGAQMYI